MKIADELVLEPVFLDFDRIFDLDFNFFREDPVYNEFTEGWNNLLVAIALEITFQETCKINSDRFNMYDRYTFLTISTMFGQLDAYYSAHFDKKPSCERKNYIKFRDDITKRWEKDTFVLKKSYPTTRKEAFYINTSISSKKDIKIQLCKLKDRKRNLIRDKKGNNFSTTLFKGD